MATIKRLTTLGYALRADGRIGMLLETRCPITQPGAMTWTSETFPNTPAGCKAASKRSQEFNGAAVIEIVDESEALPKMTRQEMMANVRALAQEVA